MLGASHTRPGGNKPGYASYASRMRWATDLLRGQGVSVAGLQEFERPQLATFRRIAPAWSAYPGSRIGRPMATANSIVWNTAVWQLVEAHTIDIPYFHGKPVPMPYIKLRHLATGQQVWFANFHNPANVRGPAGRWRAIAVARQANLAQRLSANGTPVIFTGDMNDRAEYFCPMTIRTQMHAANGGSTRAPCKPPPNMRIDWIMGNASVDFDDYRMIRDRRVARITDHPFIGARAVAGAQ